MTILLGLFSVILFLDCIVLIFLVLLQLPKKEAGAGMAFGGAATDALFGAGSGNALTTITKYSAGIFFGAALLMSILNSHRGTAGGSALEDALTKPGAASGLVPTPLSPVASTNPTGLLAPITAPAASSNSAAPGLMPPITPPTAPPTTPPGTPPAAPPGTPPAAPPGTPPAAPPGTPPAAPSPATNR